MHGNASLSAAPYTERCRTPQVADANYYDDYIIELGGSAEFPYTYPFPNPVELAPFSERSATGRVVIARFLPSHTSFCLSRYEPISAATVVSGSYVASDAPTNGGKLTILCKQRIIHRFVNPNCPQLLANSPYRLLKKSNGATGVNSVASKGTRAQSSPQVPSPIGPLILLCQWT